MKTEKKRLFVLYHVVRSIIGRHMDKYNLEEILRSIEATEGLDKTRGMTPADGAAGYYAKGTGFKDDAVDRYMGKDRLEEMLRRIQLSGGIDKTREMTQAGGRLGVSVPLDDSSNVGIGAAGHYAKGKGFKDVGVDRADVSYRKRFDNDSELRARLGANVNERAGKRGVDEIGIEYEIPFKKGGKVKAKAKVSKASKRGDGIARKGKTKGRMI